METQTKSSAKDVFINLGAIIALYTLVVSLINLLFTVINTAYPQITDSYNYMGSASISWPVATLIIFFPIYILLMWVLEKQFIVSPEKQSSGIHKILSYLTLFIFGFVVAGDLITVLYYFIDGQELSTAFLLKIVVLFFIAAAIFSYYLLDVQGALTNKSRKTYRVVALAFVLGSIIWGFSVLGSPRTQRLYKYDEQKVSDITNIDSAVQSFYGSKGVLPLDMDALTSTDYYYVTKLDKQSNKPYEYVKTGDLTYNLCAEFNKDTKTTGANGTTKPTFNYYGGVSWDHSAGHYCFNKTINPNLYAKPVAPVKY